MRSPYRDLEPSVDANAFVVRIRVETSRSLAEAPVPHIRVEHVNTRTARQFTDIDTALTHLRTCLDDIVVSSAA